MNRTRTVRENGKEIPYEEWFANQQKKLSIKRMCANTDAELRAVLDEIEHLKLSHRMMTSDNPVKALQKAAFEMI